MGTGERGIVYSMLLAFHIGGGLLGTIFDFDPFLAGKLPKNIKAKLVDYI